MIGYDLGNVIIRVLSCLLQCKIPVEFLIFGSVLKPDKGLIFIFHFNFYFDIYIFEFWGINNYWVILQIVNRRVLGQSIINFTSSDYINYSAFQKNNYMWFTLKSVHKESSLVSKDISAFKIKNFFFTV